MHAMIMTGYGGPEMLRLADVPRPEPRIGQLLVEVKAAAVNPADGKWRAGMFASFVPLSFPHVLGYDVAGVVVGGEGLAPGTRVAAMLDPLTKGGYAECVAIDGRHVALIPDSLAFETAAAIPTAGLTGAQLVERAADVKAGQHILVTGAVGAVGRFALHAARKRGARVIAAVRAAQCGTARALGADDVVALDEDGWTGQPFDHVIDTVGGGGVAALCRHLRPGGRIVTAATTPIPPGGLAAAPEFYTVVPSSEGLARLIEAVSSGEVEVPVARVMPLAAAGEAQELTARGGLGGKIILVP